MAKSNKLMVISGAIFTVFAIFYVFFFYYALAYIATQPATIAMLHYFLYWMWLYLIFAIAILIIGIIASKRENGWAIGGVVETHRVERREEMITKQKAASRAFQNRPRRCP